jgi:hypothetical protein
MDYPIFINIISTFNFLNCQGTMASMKTTFLRFSLIFLLLLTEFISLEAIWSNSSVGNATVGCIEMEREALLKFKEGLKDPSRRLSSWVGEDCCKWLGVGCSNRTGNVIKLDLKTPFFCDQLDGYIHQLYYVNLWVVFYLPLCLN